MVMMPRIEEVRGCVTANEVRHLLIKWLSFVRLMVLDGYGAGDKLHGELETLLSTGDDPTDALSKRCALYLSELEAKAGSKINADCMYHRPSSCLVLTAQGQYPASFMRLTIYTNRDRGVGMFDMHWICMEIRA